MPKRGALTTVGFGEHLYGNQKFLFCPLRLTFFRICKKMCRFCPFRVVSVWPKLTDRNVVGDKSHNWSEDKETQIWRLANKTAYDFVTFFDQSKIKNLTIQLSKNNISLTFIQ